jgi:hypothetical protein
LSTTPSEPGWVTGHPCLSIYFPNPWRRNDDP